MKQINGKSILMGVMVLAGLQFTQCKSKKSTDNSTTTTTTMDTSTTAVTPETPVQVSPDETLNTSIKDATKDYPGVNAMVSNGEVTLTGNITRDKLPNLMQAVNALHPKKINNNLTIK